MHAPLVGPPFVFFFGDLSGRIVALKSESSTSIFPGANIMHINKQYAITLRSFGLTTMHERYF